MAYRAIQAPSFSGGLNLRDSYDQLQPNQAYDLLNVSFDDRGGVASRDGFVGFAPTTGGTVTGELTNRPDCMTPFYTIGGVKQLVLGAGNRLEVYSSSGAYVAGYGLTTTVGVTFTTGATTITVASTADFPSSGQIVIGAMTITYTGKTATTFTGCTGVTAGASSGAAVSQPNPPTASPHYFARFGGKSKEVIYAANGTQQLRQWDGTSWTLPAVTGTTPTGKFVAVTPWDNRLVNARRSASTDGDNPSSVRFSDVSTPDTWQTYNWVDLSAGDGEAIMGMCAFDNYLIVFKPTKYFVFYGTSLDPTDGTPEFNYRTVNSGVGLASEGAYAVAPDGVYFMAADGIYRTNGGAPELVSALIAPLFTGNLPPLYGNSAINFGAAAKVRMTYWNQAIYVAVPTGGSSDNDTLLIYSPIYNYWTVHNVSASTLCTFKISSTDNLVFANARGLRRISRIVADAITDDGYGSRLASGVTLPTATITLDSTADFTNSGTVTVGTQTVTYTGKNDTTNTLTGCTGGTGSQATGTSVTQVAGISSRLKMAFSDFGDPNHKTIRESKLWGVGTLRYAVGADFNGSLTAGTVSFGRNTDVWGPANNDNWSDGTGSDMWRGGGLGQAQLSRNSVRAAFVSVELYNEQAITPAPWSVTRIVHHIRDQRIPSVTTIDGE